MGKSGNPAIRSTQNAAAQAEALKISQVGDFKKRLGGIMELPSGLIVKAKNPGGMGAFLSGGLIPNSLMPVIQEALDKGDTKQDGAAFLNEKGGIDPALMDDMMLVMDNVACRVIVEPKILPRLTQADVDAWNEENPDAQVDSIEDLRDDEQLYADEIPDDDKSFLFQWISGGTSDLATFRKQHQQGVDHLEKVAIARAAAQ